MPPALGSLWRLTERRGLPRGRATSHVAQGLPSRPCGSVSPPVDHDRPTARTAATRGRALAPRGRASGQPRPASVQGGPASGRGIGSQVLSARCWPTDRPPFRRSGKRRSACERSFPRNSLRVRHGIIRSRRSNGGGGTPRSSRPLNLPAKRQPMNSAASTRQSVTRRSRNSQFSNRLTPTKSPRTSARLKRQCWNRDVRDPSREPDSNRVRLKSQSTNVEPSVAKYSNRRRLKSTPCAVTCSSATQSPPSNGPGASGPDIRTIGGGFPARTTRAS